MSKNLFAYCTNDPVNHSDDDGQWKLPNWAKVAIGVAAIGVAVAVTVGTGGAAAPILISALAATGASTAIGAGIGYIIGGRRGAIDGAADGFMWGGIDEGAGAIGAAAKGVKLLKIGRMSGANTPPKYIGIRYSTGNKIRSIEIHTPHNEHGWHIQSNKWTLQNPRFLGKYYRTGVAWRKSLFRK